MADHGIHKLADWPLEKVTPLFQKRTMVGENVMMVWTQSEPGCHAQGHAHPHEQAFWILKGEMDVRLGDKITKCVEGDVILIPPNQEHEMWCPKGTEFMSVLCPIRQDLLPGVEVPHHLRIKEQA